MRAASSRDDSASGGRARWAVAVVLLTLAALPTSAQPFASGDADPLGVRPEAFLIAADSTASDTLYTSADRIGVRALRPASRLSGATRPTPEADSAWTALLRDAETEPLAPAADTTENVRKRSIDLNVFGYYRLFLYGRNITEPYPNLAPFERAYGVGDGYREPMLALTIAGRPNGRSAFGTELFIFNPYDGSEDFSTNTISLNLGINFYGNFRTEAGNFGVRAGGIHWYNLSPFTIGVNQTLDRYSIFDRTPWEGVTGKQKYEGYFLTGQANPGDERFDFQAFQGLILNGAQLPGDFAFDAFWGKTQPNGGLPGAVTDPNANVPGQGDVPDYQGFAGESRVLPSFITGGRLQRSFGANSVALNSIYSYRTLDSLTTDRRQYQVHTTSFNANAGPVNVSGELGASLFESPTYDSKWGEALMVRARTPEALTRLPLDVQVYQIGRNFFNENSEISTTNNPQLRTDPRCEVVAGSGAAGGGITQVNQLEHNRRGVNVNTEWGAGPAQFKVGWGIAHELAPTTTTLTYVHRINGLAVSRIYNPFPADAVCATRFGPLARKYSVFRGAIERAQTTDVEPVTGLAQNRKYYHAVDFQGKARARVLDRSLYFFYLGSFGSANRTARAVPTDDDTYIFAQYHEFDLYYELTPGFLLAGYLGLENIRGGQFTELDPTSGNPRDQRGRGIGLGFDWTLARNAGLYLRHRWMDFEDRSFAEDTYEGQETTLELKIFF
ncbi:hypothetical protein [Rubricoccus marinus]|nr:hypothetical protein [Rubricoccus marinus]